MLSIDLLMTRGRSGTLLALANLTGESEVPAGQQVNERLSTVQLS